MNAKNNNLIDKLIDKLSESIENLRSKYVPDMGAAETRGGEIIRALDRLTYRFYNDGDKVDEGYGIETVNSSYRYLLGHLPAAVLDTLPSLSSWTDDERYEEILLAWWQAITNYLEEHKEVFEEKNHTDSREMSEEEQEAVRRWEQDEEDDWYEEDEEEEEW